MDHNNPAFRLLSILEEGRQIPHNTACKTAWAQLLKTEGNSPELLIRLGKAMELPGIITQALQDTYPDEPNTWNHWNTQLRNAFIKQQLNGQWASFIGEIDPHSYTYLRMHAKLLDVQSNTNPLEADVLEKTRSELNECLTSLMTSDVNLNVKRYLARNLRKLIAAIDEYHITGSTGIFDSIEIIMGHQSLDPQYKAYIRESELGQKICSTVGFLANAMTITIGLPALGSSINAILGQFGLN